MADSISESHFKFLPPELMILILRKVEFVDLVNFTEAYHGCDYVLGDRQLTRNIHLDEQYFLVKDLKWLRQKVNLNHVTTLNINGLHWIQTEILTPLLRKLSNLETLYAIDTRLGFSLEDISTYNTTEKLKILAVSLRTEWRFYARVSVRSVQSLYVRLAHENQVAGISRVFPSVSALWVTTECIGTDEFVRLTSLPKIRKLIIQVVKLPMYLVRDVGHLTTYYRTFRPDQKFTQCLISLPASERKIVSIPGLPAKLADAAWTKTLEEHHTADPTGPRDALRFLTGEVIFPDLFVEELNFNHTVCIERVREVIIKILHSKLARLLKKLCVQMCQLGCQKCASSRRSEGGRGEGEPPKRQRLGTDTRECAHSAEHFLKNFPELEELEVMACMSSEPVSNIYPFALITELRKLKKLSLQLPVYVSSQFLPTVLQHCQQLQVLRIQSTVQNEALNRDIFKALPQAKCLKDFRYKNYNIPLDRLMESLCLLKTRKLQRIAIFCNTLDKFNCDLVKPFLDENPQLVLFYFRIQNITQTSARALQRTLTMYKKNHDWKLFLVGGRNYPPKEILIPPCHYDDMILSLSKVSTLDPFHDFCEFSSH